MNIDEDKLYHLAATKITLEPKIYMQTYLFGYNIEGRPNGLWCSRGSAWLDKLREQGANSTFKPCCYLYEVTSPRPPVIVDDPIKFMKKYSEYTYFLNLDFYEIKYVDKLGGANVHLRPRRSISEIYPQVIRTAKKVGLFEALLQLDMVFTDPEIARRECQTYADMGETIERYRFMRWDMIPSPILFVYDATPAHNYYFWYQSLDVTSCCYWDTNDVKIKLSMINDK